MNMQFLVLSAALCSYMAFFVFIDVMDVLFQFSAEKRMLACTSTYVNTRYSAIFSGTILGGS